MPSYALWVKPQSSAKLNVLWRYRIVVSFISVVFVVAKLQIFKCFSCNAASRKWPLFRGFWALSHANMTQVCWNFDQRYVFHKAKTVFEQSFKIPCLNGNKTYPKLMTLAHFWAQFTPRKPKRLPKTKIFSRNYILMTIKKHKSQVPDKSQNSYKINEKPSFLWLNMDFLRYKIGQ